jgi:uncharacterized protein (TIGR02147 family)
MPRPLKSIYEFANYRDFLKETQSNLKKSSSIYSHRYVAEKVGASAGGWFSNITSGRIALTGAYRVEFAKFFELDTFESDYFDFMVGYEQAGSIEEKRIIMQKIISHKGVQAEVIGKDQAKFYNHWYISAIREVLFIYDFSNGYSELAKMLIPAITVSEAKDAIKLLLEMDLIESNEKGFLKPKAKTIKNDSEFMLVNWANQMEAKGRLGVEAVSRFSKNERNVSEVFIPLSEKSYLSAVSEIEHLRKKLLGLSEEDASSNRIFQCNIQFFPLSKEIAQKGVK